MFPPEDLMDSLIPIFFEKVFKNTCSGCLDPDLGQTAPILPILHRPTFYSQYRSRLHTQDSEFATILLLVCATASRYSDDIRVLPANEECKSERERWFDAGLDYYLQICPLLFRPVFQAPMLSDLQKCAVSPQ